MKFTSWPLPPIRTDARPPQLPPKFRCFGLDYIVDNGNPKLDIPKKTLDREEMRRCIDRSMSLFVKTLKTLDGTVLDEIRDVHTRINEELNKAIALQDGSGTEEAVERKVAMKNEILEHIKKIVSRHPSSN